MSNVTTVVEKPSIMTTRQAGSPPFEWCDVCQDWHATGKCPRRMMLRAWSVMGSGMVVGL